MFFEHWKPFPLLIIKDNDFINSILETIKIILKSYGFTFTFIMTQIYSKLHKIKETLLVFDGIYGNN